MDLSRYYNEAADQIRQSVPAEYQQGILDTLKSRFDEAQARVANIDVSARQGHEDLHNQAQSMVDRVQGAWADGAAMRQHAADMVAHYTAASGSSGAATANSSVTNTQNSGVSNTVSQTTGNTGAVSNIIRVNAKPGTPGAPGRTS